MNQLPLPLHPSTRGQTRLAQVIKELAEHPINDVVLSSLAIQFIPEEGADRLLFKYGYIDKFRIHPFAFGQICNRVRLPRSYAQGLLDEGAPWATELLAHTLNKLFEMRGSGRTFLLRCVDGQIRGFLSNAYKRVDSIYLIDKFSAYANTVGAEPYDAFLTPLRVAVQAVLPTTWSVAGHELRVGVILRNSEFGAGHAEIRLCLTNQYNWSLISRRGVKKAHHGKRLSEDESDNERLKMESSKRIAEEMKDHIFRYLEQDNLNAVMTEVALSAEDTINVDKVADLLKELALDDSELKTALDAFTTDRADLPKGFTRFRMANTLAWLADRTQDPERKLELMNLAGSVLLKE